LRYNTKHMKKAFFIPVLLFLFIGCGQDKAMPITEFSQDGLTEYTLVDVRTPEEYAEGHLPNAININWYDADFLQQIGAVPEAKATTLYVYCKRGGRSSEAAQVLDSLGYRVVDLEGGYDAFLAHQKD